MTSLRMTPGTAAEARIGMHGGTRAARRLSWLAHGYQHLGVTDCVVVDGDLGGGNYTCLAQRAGHWPAQKYLCLDLQLSLRAYDRPLSNR